MVPAKSMAFVRLSDGSIIGVAQPAKDDQRLNVVTTPVAPPPAPAAPATPAPDPAATAATRRHARRHSRRHADRRDGAGPDP